MEDLAFSFIHPDRYREISRLLTTKRTQREVYILQLSQTLREELKERGLDAEVMGRPKHIYSIYQKMRKYAEQGKEFSQIYDLFALRVLVPEVHDCYSALGVIHGLYHPIPGEFDDYIGNPKDNMYQSLHTAVMYQGNTPLEIQIRTYSMHQVSEYGVAAHWRYKEGEAKDRRFEEKMSWLRQLLDWQREVVGAEEFVESVKTDLFQDQVFVYTPKGDIRELPAGSTPIDFAYRIHTDSWAPLHRRQGERQAGAPLHAAQERRHGRNPDQQAGARAKPGLAQHKPGLRKHGERSPEDSAVVPQAGAERQHPAWQGAADQGAASPEREDGRT